MQCKLASNHGYHSFYRCVSGASSSPRRHDDKKAATNRSHRVRVTSYARVDLLMTSVESQQLACRGVGGGRGDGVGGSWGGGGDE